VHDRIDSPRVAQFHPDISGREPIRNANRTPGGRLKAATGRLQRILVSQENGHLHFALGAALIAASVLAIAIPITRTSASSEPAAIDPAISSEEAIQDALGLQAETLAGLVAPQLATEAPTAAGLIPQPLLSAAAQLTVRGVLGDEGGDSSLLVPLRTTPAAYTLHESGLSTRNMTYQLTVEGALAEAGVELNEADIVVPDRDAELTAGMHVYIEYARRVRLMSGYETTETYTQALMVKDVLIEQGYDVNADDTVFPALDAPVQNGMNIAFAIVRVANETADEAIPHETRYTYDYHLTAGEEKVTQEGSDGYIRREHEVTRLNGTELRRRLLSETRVEPTTETVTIGMRAIREAAGDGTFPGQDAAPPNGEQCAASPFVWATYYTAVSAGGTITRTGTGVYKGIIATDPNYIPLGTRMYVPGYGYGIAADTGGGVHGWHVDLAYGANDVYDWGSRYLTICILD